MNVRTCMLSRQSCPTPCNPMDCTLPGSSVRGILQARILEWVSISFSKGFSQPRDGTEISCIAGRFFTDWARREAPVLLWIQRFILLILNGQGSRQSLGVGKNENVKTQPYQSSRFMTTFVVKSRKSFQMQIWAKPSCPLTPDFSQHFGVVPKSSGPAWSCGCSPPALPFFCGWGDATFLQVSECAAKS